MEMEMYRVASVFYAYILLCNLCKKIKERRKRRWAVRPLNLDWNKSGYHVKLFKPMKNVDEEQFFIHTRMSKQNFDLLLRLLGNSLRKSRQRIFTEERLSITLLFLAHGISMQSIAWSYKIGKTTVWKIILETCEMLWTVLSPLYLSPPTKSQYKDIAADFWNMWNMPNCVGAIDGKHIAMKCPKNSGSNFFNYKKFFSIVLMAACDAKYTFIAASVGAYGSESDGGVFRLSPFGKALLEDRLPLPENKPLPNSSNMEPFPHFFVGDAAFPLGNNLMKPISPLRSGVVMPLEDTIFNYRLSRARRTIENTFGILAARWRILNSTLEFTPTNCETIVLACIVLHNFIMLHDVDRWYCPESYVDRDGADNTTTLGDWRNEVGAHSQMRDFHSHSRRSSRRALDLREILRTYFANEGAVPFQPN